MLKKTIRRLGALAMVLAMAVSVFAVNASAVDEGSTGAEVGTQMTITKKVTLKEKVLAPNTEFEFTVGAGVANLKYGGYDVIQGAAGDWTVGGKVTVTKGSSTPTVATGTTTMTLNRTYDAPGIYSYTVQETKGNYDGMIYDTTVKNVLVFVEYNSTTDKYVPTKAVVVDVKDGTATVPEAEGAKSDLTFTNNYDDAEKGTHDLTVIKKVEGKLGDRSKEFKFTITINADSADQKTDTKEQYYVEISNKNGKSETTMTSGDPLNVWLRHGDTVKIYGLSPKDTYTVTEEKTEYSVEGEVKNATMGNADEEITVKNTKDTTTPGGVIMTIAPYALMVVLAGAFAVVFLTRRNRAE